MSGGANSHKCKETPAQWHKKGSGKLQNEELNKEHKDYTCLYAKNSDQKETEIRGFSKDFQECWGPEASWNEVREKE